MERGAQIAMPAQIAQTGYSGRSIDSIFVVIFSVMAFFVPAFSIGTSPVPLGFGLAGLYFLIRQPAIPMRQLQIFVLATIYLSVISARNAIDEHGSIRDFLYVMICLGQMLTFCMLYDLFARGNGDRILKLMLIFAYFNLFLMVCQLLNIFGIDKRLIHLWELPWNLVRRDNLAAMHASDVGGRPYGLMAGFNVASMALYIVFRAAWLRFGLVRYRFLGLAAIVVSSARMLTVFFILYEVLAPLFIKDERKKAVPFLLIGGGLSAILLFLIARFMHDFFLLQFISNLQQSGLSNNDSYTNRLETLHLAMDNLDKIFLFGGIHANDFLSLSRAIDSEVLLRSMQFGWLGFVLLNLMIYFYFDKYRSYGMLFLLGIMLWTSITFTAASNFVFTPFLLLYGFVCRDAGLHEREQLRKAHWKKFAGSGKVAQK
jgi:hypothetical protein